MIMKTKVYILLILVLSSINGFSQEWQRTYGLSNTRELSFDVTESYDKGYYILGYEDEKTLLLKTDINGYLLWQKTIICEGTNMSFDLEPTSDGGLIIAGRASIFENIVDPMVMKLDSCGDKEWCLLLKTPGEMDYAIKIKEIDDGYIMLTRYNSYDPDERVHLQKLSKNGEIIWKKLYASVNDHPYLINPESNDLILTKDNGYLITGRCNSQYPNDTTGYYWMRGMLIKIDSLGNEEWIATPGINDSLIGVTFHTKEYRKNTFFTTGVYWSPGDTMFPVLYKFNGFGEEIYHKILRNITVFGNIYDSHLVGIEIDNNNLIVGDVHNYEYAGESTWGTLKLDTLGQILDYLDTPGSIDPWSMTKTHYNKFLVCSRMYEPGSTSKTDILLIKLNAELEYDTLYPGTYTYDSLCPYPIPSDTLYIDNCMVIVDMDEVPVPEEYYSKLKSIPVVPYPNPAQGKSTCALENTQHHKNSTVQCYNIFGSLIDEQQIIPGQLEAECAVSKWDSGMYVVVVRSDGKVLGESRFVVGD